MKHVRLVALAAVLVVAAAVTTGALASPPAPAFPPGPPAFPPGPPARLAAGHVYVNDNTAGVNTVAGFNRQPDGSLTPIPGSPFAVGGAGAGHADASQGSLELSSDGRFLLAVDAGSNQISVARIMPDGSLQQGDVVSSGGGNPVSIAVHNQLVYVANADPTSPSYTGFTIDPAGYLNPIPGSTIALPAGSQPGDILFDPTGTKLVATRVGSSMIDSFTVAPDGRLIAAPGSPFPAQTGFFGPFGSEFSPTEPDRLYVSNAHTSAGGGATPGTVSAFDDAPNGALTALAGSPYADDGTAACWVEISHDGRTLYAVNTGNATISTFTIAPFGALVFLSSTSLDAAGAEDARLAPDGRTLYVVESGAHAISGFAVAPNGSLTKLPSSPTATPAGSAPSGIVVTAGPTPPWGPGLPGLPLPPAGL
jgi:6-phosphogluconolactonase